MARSTLAAVESTDAVTSDTPSTDAMPSDTVQPARVRELGPKTVYIQVANAEAKELILSVHTNTRTLVDAIDANPGSTYVKRELPMGEPRGPKGKPAQG